MPRLKRDTTAIRTTYFYVAQKCSAHPRCGRVPHPALQCRFAAIAGRNIDSAPGVCALSHSILRNERVLYNQFEVSFMPIKKIKTSSNGTLPTAKDFPPPKKLTPAQKELRKATRAAMKALDERIKKHGYPPDFRH